MAVIAAVAGFLFWISVWKIDRDEDKLNNLSAGHVGTVRTDKEM
jgi:POT family proton-dependent oligopeptide transporter